MSNPFLNPGLGADLAIGWHAWIFNELTCREQSPPPLLATPVGGVVAAVASPAVLVAGSVPPQSVAIAVCEVLLAVEHG